MFSARDEGVAGAGRAERTTTSMTTYVTAIMGLEPELAIIVYDVYVVQTGSKYMRRVDETEHAMVLVPEDDAEWNIILISTAASPSQYIIYLAPMFPPLSAPHPPTPR
jgi:hypothetical protein